jgi:hypothetical protein
VKVFIGLSVVLWLGGLPWLSALNSQDLNRVTFVNETGKRLVQLFVSPRDSQQWGPDILLRKVFDYGSIRDYYVNYEGVKTAFDFLAFDERQNAYLIEAFEVRDNVSNVVNFTVQNALRYAPKLTLVNVFVTNATNRVIAYFFFSPIDASDWGFDILNDTNSLQSGGSVVFAVPVGQKATTFELLAVGKDQTLVQRRISLSASKGDTFLDFTLSDLH